MAKVSKLEIILNEKAGNGQSLNIWKTVTKYLDSNKISYEIHTTKRNGDGVRVAKELANSLAPDARIIVLGGDGTLNQALNGIRESSKPDTPLGYIPGGSGNDFSRGIKIRKQNPDILIQKIMAMNSPKIIDVGKAEFTDKTKYFVNNIGIGLDAYTVYETNHSKRKDLLNKMKLGTLAYVSSLVTVIKNQDAFPLDVTVNGETKHFEDAYIVSATNHPYFGGGVAIDPLATPFDQKLDLVVVHKISGWTFIKLFVELFSNGSHLNDKNVWHTQNSSYRLTSYSPEQGQMDGEELGNNNFDIKFTVDKHPFWIPIGM
ncbi:diacylglycerol/lipid kinase family protein [Companilactobacillus hulinensis]|uniref:diacylglycerol/lipid kinase family protein n=1 Tax=Companilactobacillus hulinensis TaxID=2486007 RepID=UPI000F7A81EA|nr:diacylglycerol kinase family protein [Companilactobacillus hulinensis]